MATPASSKPNPKAELNGIGVFIDDDEEPSKCTWRGGMKKVEAIAFIEENMGYTDEIGLVYIIQSFPPKNLNELIPQYAGTRDDLIMALKS